MSDSVRPHRQRPTRIHRPWDSPGKNTGVGCHFLLQCMKGKSESEVVQSCPTLRDPMVCSLPGSSFHGVFQARVLEWGAIAFSPVSSITELKQALYFQSSVGLSSNLFCTWVYSSEVTLGVLAIYSVVGVGIPWIYSLVGWALNCGAWLEPWVVFPFYFLFFFGWPAQLLRF